MRSPPSKFLTYSHPADEINVRTTSFMCWTKQHARLRMFIYVDLFRRGNHQKTWRHLQMEFRLYNLQAKKRWGLVVVLLRRSHWRDPPVLNLMNVINVFIACIFTRYVACLDGIVCIWFYTAFFAKHQKNITYKKRFFKRTDRYMFTFKVYLYVWAMYIIYKIYLVNKIHTSWLLLSNVVLICICLEGTKDMHSWSDD